MNNEKAVEYILLVLSCLGILFCLGAFVCLAPLCQCCSYTYWEARRSFRKFWVVKALILFFAAIWIASNILDLQIILWSDNNYNSTNQELSALSDGSNYNDSFYDIDNTNTSLTQNIANNNTYTELDNNGGQQSHVENSDDGLFNVDIKTLQLMCRLYLFIGIGISLPMFLWLSYLALKACCRCGVGNYERWLWGENGSIILRALLYSAPFMGITFFGAWLETDLDSKTHIFSRDEQSWVSCSDWTNSVLISVGLVIFVLLVLVYFGKAALLINKIVINYDYKRRMWLLYLSVSISLIIYAAAVITQFSVVEIDWLRNFMRVLRVLAQLVNICSVSLAMIVMPSISSCQADIHYKTQDTEMRLLLYQQFQPSPNLANPSPNFNSASQSNTGFI